VRREEQTIRDSLRILETPPLPLPLRGGEWLPPEKNSWVNCYIIAYLRGDVEVKE
jgi:hypothetical protein